jgi:benzil reductase ((S)-benzoin forming)
MTYYFITGGSRGIGEALIKELLLIETNQVYNYSRSQSISNKRCSHQTIDLSTPDSLLDFSFPDIKHADHIVLINNAGVLGEVAPVGQKQSKAIINTFNVNTIAPAVLSNQFVKQFQKLNASKLIINISSGAGRHTMNSWAEYCASKSALDMHSMVISEEQKKETFPIKIVSLAPGVIDTKMQDEIREIKAEKFDKLAYFVNLKETHQLDSAEFVAKKIIQNIPTFIKSKETLLDLRQM